MCKLIDIDSTLLTAWHTVWVCYRLSVPVQCHSLGSEESTVVHGIEAATSKVLSLLTVCPVQLINYEHRNRNLIIIDIDRLHVKA